MKLRLLCLSWLVAGCVINIAAADDWAQFQKYEKANASLKADTVRPRILFMGNSITEGWVEKHPAFFTENGFEGRGISGQTSYQMLLRFRDDVINLHPEYVVINAGTNDIAENNHTYSEDRTFGNIVSMVELAQANGIKPILTTILPVNEIYWRKSITDVPQKVGSLNDRLRSYAETHNLPFIDYYTPLADSNKGLDKAYTADGVHPNLAGYLLMEEALLKTPLP